MKIFTLKFTGRKVGAIGAFEQFEINIEANSAEEATLKIYDTHEHILDLHINGEQFYK